LPTWLVGTPMAKFYAASILLSLIGMAAYIESALVEERKWPPILLFLGVVLTLTGLACFVLVFGYHVRSTVGTDTDLKS
jgi:hypothetical protein